MAQYLRDAEVSNLTINSEALSHLFDEFERRQASMPENAQTQEDGSSSAWLWCIIRFDEKGYRVFDKDRLLDCFEKASKVERVIFTLESVASIQSNRRNGSYMECRLESGDSANPRYIVVSSENEDWVNASFTAVQESLTRFRDRSSLFRNPFVDLLIQLLGLIIGIVVSLWAATLMAPYLTIENAFLISFLIVLILFSNLWAPITFRLRQFVYLTFPVIKFYRSRKDTLLWLRQAIVGGVVAALTIGLLLLIVSWVGRILGGFIESGS